MHSLDANLPTKRNIQLSKTLSWLLRHGALKEGLPLKPDGFLPVTAILAHKKFANLFTLDILQTIVDTDKKQRYILRRNSTNNEIEIRANQGHSLDLVQSELCLKIICDPCDVPIAVHGTYYRHWPKIKEGGLRCMSRNHIHFAATDTTDQHISGFRSDCQLLIYIDVQKAMNKGRMRFYRSANNVILCSGIDGCISKYYFYKVVDKRTGKAIDF